MNKKEVDIRGKYPHDFNEETARDIILPFIFGKSKKVSKIIIGYDARLSSPAIFKAIQNEIKKHLPNAKIINLQLCTTPQIQFTTYCLGADLGVMVTASHNPAEYNGLKIISNYGGEYYSPKKKPVDLYVEYLAGLSNIKSPMRVVFDCSNGSVGPILEKLLPKLKNIEGKLINATPDGNFPAHGPNPIKPTATKDLETAVKKFNADLGVIFDGDGDRAFFVDEKGKKIDTEIISRLLLLYLDPENIVIDSTVGKMFKDGVGIKRVEIVPVHSDINSFMRKENITFGFERSGHFYFSGKLPNLKNQNGLKDKAFNFDSGILASVYVMSAISILLEEPISKYVKQFSKQYFKAHKDFKVKDPDKLMENIENKYKKKAKISKLDGLSIECPSWWANIRKSTTEPVVRLSIESDNKELANEKFKEITSLFDSSN